MRRGVGQPLDEVEPREVAPGEGFPRAVEELAEQWWHAVRHPGLRIVLEHSDDGTDMIGGHGPGKRMF